MAKLTEIDYFYLFNVYSHTRMSKIKQIYRTIPSNNNGPPANQCWTRIGACPTWTCSGVRLLRERSCRGTSTIVGVLVSPMELQKQNGIFKFHHFFY